MKLEDFEQLIKNKIYQDCQIQIEKLIINIKYNQPLWFITINNVNSIKYVTNTFMVLFTIKNLIKQMHT